eukprot:Gb_12912 [translate_table: standard]
MTPRRSPRLITTSTQALNFDGGLKRSREEDSHKNPEDDDANKLQLEIDCTPKSKRAKMEVSKKSPNKVCRALNMQGSENGAHSNGKNEKEMQAKKGSRNNLSNGVCDETVAKQSQNMGFDEQPNGNGGSRTPKKVLVFQFLFFGYEILPAEHPRIENPLAGIRMPALNTTSIVETLHYTHRELMCPCVHMLSCSGYGVLMKLANH